MLKHRVTHRRNLIYLYDGVAPKEVSLPPGFSLIRITPDNLNLYMSIPGLEGRKSRYQRFYEAGATGFMVVSENSWAAAAWIAPPTLIELPPQIPPVLARRGNWFFEAHTYEPYRGKGLHKALVVHRLRFLAEAKDGRAVAFADVNPANTPSRRSYLRLGFKEEGVMDIWKFRIPKIPATPVGLWRKNAKHSALSSESNFEK